MKEVAGMALRKNVPLNESKINIKYLQFKLDTIFDLVQSKTEGLNFCLIDN